MRTSASACLFVYPTGNRPAVGTVHQELGLFGEGTVVENVFALQEGSFLSSRVEETVARDILGQVGARFPIDRKVADLPGDEQAMVAVARALFAMRHAKRAVLVVDEVTSILRGAAAQRFVDSLRRLRGLGVGIVFVSHELDEVLGLADRIAVLRDGTVRAVLGAYEVRRERLIELMTGGVAPVDITSEARDQRLSGVVLAVEHLHGATVDDVSFEVRSGEIVGLTGVAGSGYDDVPYLIAGSVGPRSGTVTLDGRAVATPPELAARGGRVIPADRNHRAIVPAGTVLENYLLDHKAGFSRFGLSRRRHERRMAAQRFIPTA